MISFEIKNVSMPTLDFAKVEDWLGQVAALHNKKIGNLNYLFCDDEEILRVNKEFLNHDYFTDIITFDYSRRDRVGGDIFISLDTVKSNSELLKENYDTELLRVIVHGLLHLCGIDDKGEGQRAIMEHHENEALLLWNKLTFTTEL
ncbi:MAG: rRNA maturation RNase YbeY [Muribaculaceae bacterium]|nr:rRNA maturation RNase YbeY [Muribaculaceae bacterium]